MNKMKLTTDEKKLTRSLFLRSFMLEASFNFEKMQALGFAWAIYPVIRKFYKEEADQKEALKRHTAFFNITPYISPFLLGLSASMEKEYAEKKSIDPAMINAIKVSLMGPLSGIGDSFYWGTFRVIAAGVGISLAQQGNILGPFVFLLIFNVPHLLIRYYCSVMGYSLGSKFIKSSYENGLISHMTKLATVIGLTTVGAMIATMVVFTVGFRTEIGGMEFVLQDIFDQIVPNILPLGLTFFVFWMIRKGVKINYLIIGVFAFGLLGTLIGLL